MRLGDALHGAGNAESARLTWRSALDILEQLNHPDAKGVHAKLQELEQQAT